MLYIFFALFSGKVIFKVKKHFSLSLLSSELFQWFRYGTQVGVWTGGLRNDEPLLSMAN